MNSEVLPLEQENAKVALAAYRATNNRKAAVQLMMNNTFMDKSTCIVLWETIDAVYDDINCAHWHSDQRDIPCE